MNWALLLFVLGAASLWLATRDFRDFRNQSGDFSEWVVSDARKLNRELWRANAWTQMLVQFVTGVACLGAAVWLMIE